VIEVLGTTSAAVAGIGTGAWAARALFHRALLRGLRAPRVPHDPPLTARPLQQARIESLWLCGPQGRPLAAWMVRPNDTAGRPTPAVLAMHGWGANASTLWPLVAPLAQAGMATLLFDARCHGNSADEPFTSMPRFAEDIAAALSWLRRHGGIDARRIALVGHSVGAAAVLLLASGRIGAGDVDAPPLRALVSLAAFAHPEEMMRRWLAEHRIPQKVVGAAVLRHVQRVIGHRFDDIAPLHTIRDVTCPVLLVHGRDDSTVPFADARRLLTVAREASRTAELLAVDGGHDLRAALAPHGETIVDFLQRSMANGRPPGPRRQSALAQNPPP
jgi:dipeptidyl aminopeptidase/acylaminoacyl peptidase